VEDFVQSTIRAIDSDSTKEFVCLDEGVLSVPTLSLHTDSFLSLLLQVWGRHIMVSPDCYSTDIRRLGNRMSVYPSYPERRVTSYPIHSDTRTTIMSDRDDDVTPQRKRIAVAVSQDLF
jgi:hypothetical protein